MGNVVKKQENESTEEDNKEPLLDESDNKNVIKQRSVPQPSPQFCFINGGEGAEGERKRRGAFSRWMMPPIEELTVVDDRLFAIPGGHLRQHHGRHSTISVYDLNTFSSLPSIKVLEMKRPHQIAGCSHNKALYINDYKDCLCLYGDNHKYILKINLADNSVSKWNMTEYPYGLSVTLEHNVLVYVQEFLETSCIKEYTSEGQLIREIQLDKTISLVRQLSADLFIVVQSGDVFDRVSGLSVVNCEGQIVKSHIRKIKRTSYTCMFMTPNSLTVDYSRELIFVADYINHRFVMFNFDLVYLGEVSTGESCPTCVYMNAATDQLFAVEGVKSGCVLVINAPDQWITSEKCSKHTL